MRSRVLLLSLLLPLWVGQMFFAYKLWEMGDWVPLVLMVPMGPLLILWCFDQRWID